MSGLFRIIPRRSSDRGFANLGWLYTFHTFSFGSYSDSRFDGFHSLRVLNEDRVKPRRGFGFHRHENFEIFSYIVSGELTHRDSMDNEEVLKRGDVQFTSAGTGMGHSECNEHESRYVHFIQMWVVPDKEDLKPRYETKSFKEQDKFGKFVPLVSQRGADDSGAIKINQDIRVLASIIGGDSEAKSAEYEVGPGRVVYVHVIQDAVSFDREARRVGITIDDTTELRGGDGAYIRRDKDSEDFLKLRFTALTDYRTEFLLFDIRQDPSSI